MIAAVVTLALWDLDGSDGGFVASGSVGQWEWGAPTTGPGGASRVWATQLGRSYLHDGEDRLEIQVPDLGTATDPVLVLDHWYEIVAGDFGTVEIETSSGWVMATPVYGYPTASGFSGYSAGWTTSAFDLSGLAPGGGVRLVFRSDLLLAGAGWYVRSVGIYDGDATPPRLQPTITPVDTQDLDGPYLVEVEAEDDVGVAQIEVRALRQDGVELIAAATPLGGGLWRAELAGQAPGATLWWAAYARDLEGNEARWPVEGEESFRVYLAAPTGLRGPSGRVVGTTVDLAWEAPISPEPVLGYQVVESGSDPIEVGGPAATVPLTDDGSHLWTVYARYSAGLGDPSAPLALDAEATTLGAVSPASAWPGDRLRVRIEGSSLYLLGGVSVADLGDGIAIESLEVIDANTAVALLTIHEDAPPGPRALSISGAFGAYTFPEAFAVDDAAGRPRVVEVTPEVLPQGWQGTVTVEVSAPFSGPCVVDLPGDLVAAADPVVQGAELSIDVVVSGRAAPGARKLVIDDGERLWEVPFTIEERSVEVRRGCATSPGGGPWALAALLGLLRRQRASIRAARS